MSKHSSPKSQGSRQQRAPSAPANSGDPELRQDGSLSEGDGVILGMGSGFPGRFTHHATPSTHRGSDRRRCGRPVRMGDLCRTGDEFTPQDYAEALRWYQARRRAG